MIENIEKTKKPYSKLRRLIKYLSLVSIIIVLFLSGYVVGSKNKKFNSQVSPSLSPYSKSSEKTSIKFEFLSDFSADIAPFMAPSFVESLKNKKFTPLICLGGLPNDRDYDFDNQVLNSIKALKRPDDTLATAIENIYNHEFDYEYKSYKPDEITIDTQKTVKVKAKIQLLSVCKTNEGYFALYNARFTWNSITNKLNSLIPIAYASGGPEPYKSYLSFIDWAGKINYYDLSAAKGENVFSPIAAKSLRSSGYMGDRRIDMLYPNQILGKVDDSLLISFETACYECRDNPGEQSVYLLSLDPLKGKEVSFCKNNSELAGEQCYDSNGKYLSLEW